MISFIKKIPEGLYVQLSGNITLQTLKENLKTILNSVEFDNEMCIFWDTSQVDDFNITSMDIEEIGEYLKTNFDKRGAGKSAWLLSDTVHLGMAQMFIELNKKSLPFELRTFNDRTVALQWLKS